MSAGGSAGEAPRGAGTGGDAASGAGTGGDAGLLDPNGVALAPSGEVLYVADTGDARIVRFNASGQPLGTFRSAPLVRPVALAVGPRGDLYVADAGADRVFELSPTGALLTAWGGPGAAPGRFAEPAGIAVDSAGDVFVTDHALDRVQEFTPAGASSPCGERPGVAPGELGAPTGIATDCRGEVLVADTANNRVQSSPGPPRALCAHPPRTSRSGAEGRPCGMRGGHRRARPLASGGPDPTRSATGAPGLPHRQAQPPLCR